MREDWTETTLGEVCRLVKGISYKSDELVAEGEGIPFINLKSIDRGGGFRADGLKWFLGKFKEEQLVRAGDLVICCTDLTKEKAILGYPLLVPKLDSGNQFCISLDMANLIVNKNMSSNEFMYLVLQGRQMREFMTSNSSGTTVMHLQTRNVSSARFRLPPLVEQKRIVDLVSSVDAYIAALELQADKARTARNAVLHELLLAGGDDWTETKLENIVEKIGMGPFGSNIKVSTFVDFGVPVISGSHLVADLLSEVSFNFVEFEHADRLKGSNVFRGDLVLTHAGTVGQVSLIPVNSSYERYVVSQRGFYIRPNRVFVLPEYLLLYLKYGEGHNQLMSNINRTGVPSLSQPVSFTKNMRVQLPPILEQKRIVDIVSSMDGLIQAAERAVVVAKHLRSGLLSDLLSGEHEIPESYDRLLGAA